MAGEIIIDAGPLYAYLDGADSYHNWAIKQFAEIEPPFLTCESVLSEVIFLLQRANIDTDAILKIVKRGDLNVKPIYSKKQHQERIRTIITTYANLPASFAVGCLIQMYETTNDARIFTLDTDFTIYRTARGDSLSLIIPN